MAVFHANASKLPSLFLPTHIDVKTFIQTHTQKFVKTHTTHKYTQISHKHRKTKMYTQEIYTTTKQVKDTHGGEGVERDPEAHMDTHPLTES